jgi:hypothetical protein
LLNERIDVGEKGKHAGPKDSKRLIPGDNGFLSRVAALAVCEGLMMKGIY